MHNNMHITCRFTPELPMHTWGHPPCHTRLVASLFRYHMDWWHIPAQVDFWVVIGYRGKSITSSYAVDHRECTTQTACLSNVRDLKMLLIIQSHLFSRSIRCRELSDGIAIRNSLFLQVLSKRPLSLPAVSCLMDGRLEAKLNHLPFNSNIFLFVFQLLLTRYKKDMTAAVIYVSSPA